MVGGEQPRASNSTAKQADGGSEPAKGVEFGKLLSEVPSDIRDVSFASAVRGYDRRAVDAYVEQVNRVIAELEISRSPQSAVKHALDRVGQQTSGVLQRAREVADELTSTALAEAEHATRRATVEAEETLEQAQMQAHQVRGQSKEEAEEIVARARAEAAESLKRAEEQTQALQADAEGRLRALQADIDAAAAQRRSVLDELRRTAAELEQFANGAIDRVKDGGADQPARDQPTEKLPPKTAVQPREEETAGSASRERAKRQTDAAK